MVGNKEKDLIMNADTIATDVAKVLYEKKLEALVATLDRFHVPRDYYSVMESRDEAVCLVYRNGIWVTFMSERGNETDIKTSQDLESACEKLFSAFADDDIELSQMVFYFREQVKNSNPNEIDSSEIFTAIKEGLKKITSAVAVL